MAWGRKLQNLQKSQPCPCPSLPGDSGTQCPSLRNWFKAQLRQGACLLSKRGRKCLLDTATGHWPHQLLTMYKLEQSGRLEKTDTSAIPLSSAEERRPAVLRHRGHGLGKPAGLGWSKLPSSGMNDRTSWMCFQGDPGPASWHRQKPAQAGDSSGFD